MVKFWPADLELALWKKYFLFARNEKVKKELMLKFKMIFRTCLNFVIAFMVYEKRTYIDVRYEDTYPEKND